MAKIGDQFIKVDNYEKVLVVYVKQPGLSSPGDILVTGESGRKWLSNKELSDDYVEAF